MKSVLQIEHLTKSYQKTTVVKDISLDIPKGHICGLIGPNGAGKTTIMKILAGLSSADSGNLLFFGDENLDKQRSRMSFMIESPAIDPHMTAKQNLQYVRYVKGVADEKRIDEVLEFVGLETAGKKKAENFSLGMKQRLGIAMALLSSPEIMVLDEPINGLDPEGIVDIRCILKKLCEEQNVTILISSHILSEMAELCTDFVIVNKGRLIEKLSSGELAVKCKNHITLKTTDDDKTAMILESKLNIKDYKVLHNGEIHIYEALEQIETISKTITDNNLVLLKLIVEGETLENYYLSKVGELK